jgi:hypothetical protein
MFFVVYDFYPTIPFNKPKKYGLRGELQKDEPENYHAETCDRSGPQDGLGGGTSPQKLYISYFKSLSSKNAGCPLCNKWATFCPRIVLKKKPLYVCKQPSTASFYDRISYYMNFYFLFCFNRRLY